MREEYWGPNDRWVDIPIQVRKYIDVFSAIEKLPKFRCNRHLSTARPKLLAHAEKSESLFDGMNVGSGEKGMRINKKKNADAAHQQQSFHSRNIHQSSWHHDLQQ